MIVHVWPAPEAGTGGVKLETGAKDESGCSGCSINGSCAEGSFDSPPVKSLWLLEKK
jgi:hypothetical protein